MKIAEHALTMQTSHSSSQQSSVRENLRIWIDPPVPARIPASDFQQVTISAAAQEKQAGEAGAIDNALSDVENDPRMQLIILMVERMTGQKVRLYHANPSGVAQPVSAAPPSAHSAPAPAPAPRAGFGVEYDKVLSYSESEQTTMQASGVVKTSDGKEIEFSPRKVLHKKTNQN